MGFYDTIQHSVAKLWKILPEVRLANHLTATVIHYHQCHGVYISCQFLCHIL
jgi:hypothetical protein